MARVSAGLREKVRRRARARCEYCQMPEQFYRANFQPDHIIAEVHGESSTGENLCWACFHCNLHKGTNLAGVDAKTGKKAWLYHPRRMKWARHFRWDGPILVGQTPEGRATVSVLKINDEEYVRTRASLIAEGVFPPM
jgi:HNH endonuclease